MSLPSQGAWIEMCVGLVEFIEYLLSLPSQGAWIEMELMLQLNERK